MRIKMIENVISNIPFLAKPGTFLCAGVEYEAKSNKYGAISALCDKCRNVRFYPKFYRDNL